MFPHYTHLDLLVCARYYLLTIIRTSPGRYNQYNIKINAPKSTDLHKSVCSDIELCDMFGQWHDGSTWWCTILSTFTCSSADNIHGVNIYYTTNNSGIIHYCKSVAQEII